MTQCSGSPYYVAPEVLKFSYDLRCDIWSMGVILYELMTLDRPFRTEQHTQSIVYDD